MATDWEKYENTPGRIQYKKDWYQENKVEQRIKNYRSRGLNFIRNYASIDDLSEFKDVIAQREAQLKEESKLR